MTRSQGVIKLPYKCLDCGEYISDGAYPYHNADHTLKEIQVTTIKLRSELMSFAEAMECRLQKHDKNKGSTWKEMSFQELKDLLHKEIDELPKGLGEVGEYVDVANFCFFLWWRQIAFGCKSFQDVNHCSCGAFVEGIKEGEQCETCRIYKKEQEVKPNSSQS